MSRDPGQEFDRLSRQAHQLSKEGRFPEAIELATRARDLVRRSYGGAHPDYAVSLSNLAGSFSGWRFPENESHPMDLEVMNVTDSISDDNRLAIGGHGNRQRGLSKGIVARHTRCLDVPEPEGAVIRAGYRMAAARGHGERGDSVVMPREGVILA